MCGFLVFHVKQLLSKEGDVRQVFQSLHSAYIDAVSNPFYTPGKKIESKVFERTVDEIVSSAPAA